MLDEYESNPKNRIQMKIMVIIIRTFLNLVSGGVIEELKQYLQCLIQTFKKTDLKLKQKLLSINMFFFFCNNHTSHN